ncbi:hypothetical protein C8F04DRAFT_1272573 [Mycena alexandri]|uniref:Uncharacterized protein n=1 Tax=Mycena alexandri TaxID=1745969 RepID=A0AAD6WPQ3_9AGAR|nr:hypothetical protein C8F04DRAFT_1272573 [Mycena alexandri]
MSDTTKSTPAQPNTDELTANAGDLHDVGATDTSSSPLFAPPRRSNERANNDDDGLLQRPQTHYQTGRGELKGRKPPKLPFPYTTTSNPVKTAYGPKNPATTLAKFAKPDDGTFRLPPSRNNSPRDTPATRKSYRVTTAPFAGPSRGPNSLETTSALPFDYGSSDDETPLDHLDLASPSKRPIRSNPRTRAHRSVSPTPNDSSMNVDDVFGQNYGQVGGQGFQFITPPPASPPPQPAVQPPPPPPPAAAPPAPAPAQLFGAANIIFNNVANAIAIQTPADLALLNHAVVGREDNGYLGTQAPMDTPPVNAEGKTIIQRNDGTNPNLVLTVNQVLHGIHPTQRVFIQENWNDILMFVMFLGGQSFFAKYGNVINDVYDALSGYHAFNRELVDIYHAVPDNEEPIVGAYGGPKVLIAHLKHEGMAQTHAIKTVLSGQRTFACTDILGWHAVNLEEAVGLRDYALASYAVSTEGATPPSSNDTRAAGRGSSSLRPPSSCRTLTTIQEGDQQTQALSNASLQERIEDLVWTIDAKYFDHETDPIVTIYMRPITDNPADHERIARLMRPRSFHMGPLSFTPKAYHNEAPECVICTSGDHFAYLCPFTRLPAFWGPKKQISRHTEGILARARGRGRGFARGAFARGGPRGRGHAQGRGRGAPTRSVRGGRGRGNA